AGDVVSGSTVWVMRSSSDPVRSSLTDNSITGAAGRGSGQNAVTSGQAGEPRGRPGEHRRDDRGVDPAYQREVGPSPQVVPPHHRGEHDPGGLHGDDCPKSEVSRGRPDTATRT